MRNHVVKLANLKPGDIFELSKDPGDTYMVISDSYIVKFCAERPRLTPQENEICYIQISGETKYRGQIFRATPDYDVKISRDIYRRMNCGHK